MNYFSVQDSILKRVIVTTIPPPFLLFLKEGLIWFIGYCLLLRDAEARTKDWSHGEGVLPGLLPLSCLTTFLTQPGPSGAGMELRWAGSSYIYWEPRKCTTDMPTSQSDDRSSSGEVSSSQVCQIDNKN